MKLNERGSEKLESHNVCVASTRSMQSRIVIVAGWTEKIFYSSAMDFQQKRPWRLRPVSSRTVEVNQTSDYQACDLFLFGNWNWLIFCLFFVFCFFVFRQQQWKKKKTKREKTYLDKNSSMKVHSIQPPTRIATVRLWSQRTVLSFYQFFLSFLFFLFLTTEFLMAFWSPQKLLFLFFYFRFSFFSKACCRVTGNSRCASDLKSQGIYEPRTTTKFSKYQHKFLNWGTRGNSLSSHTKTYGDCHALAKAQTRWVPGELWSFGPGSHRRLCRA